MTRSSAPSDAEPTGGSGASSHSRERFAALAADGFLRHAIPRELGGHGDGFAALNARHYELGRASHGVGLLLMLNAHLWGAVFPLLRHGTPEQRERWLPPLLSGVCLAGHAITEPHCGSDLQGIAARAERCRTGYRLTGRKRYISNASGADAMVVYAKLEGRLAAFWVQRGDPGCAFTDAHAVAACLDSGTGEIELTDCCIEQDRLLGKPASGENILRQALEWERAFVFAGIAGVMAWQLDTVVAYARSRTVAGEPLGRHQAIAHRIAEMKLRLDTLALWLGECVRRADCGERLTQTAAEVKWYGAEAFLQGSLDAVQILGALGLEAETGLVQCVQDALAARLFSGSSEVQKNIVAALLGTGEGYRGRS